MYTEELERVVVLFNKLDCFEYILNRTPYVEDDCFLLVILCLKIILIFRYVRFFLRGENKYLLLRN